MHFPPGDDGDDIAVPLLPESENHEALLSTLPGNPYAGWTEPALRSDKMCWSLVSFAYTLSYELGIFDSLIDHGKWYPYPQAKTANEGRRANRIGRVLHIYVSQTCGRLGFPNILPHKGTETDVDYMKMNVLLPESCEYHPVLGEIYLIEIQLILSKPIGRQRMYSGHGLRSLL